MKPHINRARLLRIFAIVTLLLTGLSPHLQAFADEATPVSMRMAAPAEPTTLQIKMNDASGLPVTFVPGTQICFDVLTGGVVFQSRCLTGIYDPDILIAGAPDPDLGAYTMRITSNTTTCTASAVAPYITNSGTSKFVTMELLITCPSMPVPTDFYSFIAIEYVDSTGAAVTYPGQLCVDLVIPVGSTFPAPRTQCSDSTGRIWSHFAAPGLVPHDLAYSASVVSNDTGCTVAPSFLEVTDDSDIVATVRMTLTCTPPAPESYDGVVITLRDSTGATTTYPGLMCVDFAVSPSTTIPSHATPCSTATGNMLVLYGDPGVFPVTSTYTAVFGLNLTRCGSSYAVSTFTESGESFLIITVTLTCEVPAPSVTAIPTATLTPTPTATATATMTPTGTSTPTPTATATMIPTGTTTPTPTETATVVVTPTGTSTMVPTASTTVSPTTTPPTGQPGTTRPGSNAGAVKAPIQAAPKVTGLPKTGAGISRGLMIASALGITAFALLLVSAIWIRMPRR